MVKAQCCSPSKVMCARRCVRLCVCGVHACASGVLWCVVVFLSPWLPANNMCRGVVGRGWHFGGGRCRAAEGGGRGSAWVPAGSIGSVLLGWSNNNPLKVVCARKHLCVAVCLCGAGVCCFCFVILWLSVVHLSLRSLAYTIFTGASGTGVAVWGRKVWGAEGGGRGRA
jgi:hypothetical protein